MSVCARFIVCLFVVLLLESERREGGGGGGGERERERERERLGGGGGGGGRVRETYFKLTTCTYYMLLSAMNVVHYSNCQVVCGVLMG